MSLILPEGGQFYLEDGALACGAGPASHQQREPATTVWLRKDGEDWRADFFRCPAHGLPPGLAGGLAEVPVEELAAWEVHEG